MRLYLQHLNLRSSDVLDSWIEHQILALGESRQITEANVRLIRRRDASPAYHVDVHLVTPGPDVVAEGRDHTVHAAASKVMRQLRAQIDRRARKPLQRVKSNLSRPPARRRGALLS